MKKTAFPSILSVFLWLIIFAGMFSATSCRKDKFNTSSGLDLSIDTLTFDTLFTTLGSTTQFFTIRNTTKQAIKISNIRLGGGAASSYRMNVDGDSGTTFSNIEIPAKDSIYVFVEVTINPNAANLPFILLDSILFNTNGNEQKVVLQAYGQNAHFFNADSIEHDTVWGNDLPYVILNYLQIKPGASLTIENGCTIYFGGGAAMIVEGDLQINGTDTSHMVTFRGVRLDKDITGEPYDDFPGQYAGLFFLRGSTGNIQFLKMRNSAYGINVGNIKSTGDEATDVPVLMAMNLGNAPVVTIKNSKIYNNAFYGIFGFFGKIFGENLSIYNCGKNVIGLYDGGDYEFRNSTFYTRGSAFISHSKDPAFYMNNYFSYSIIAPAITADTSRALFINCILYGTLEEEIVAEGATTQSHTIDLQFKHCVVKTKSSLTLPIFNICKGDDPQFKDVFNDDFHLKGTSPCIDFSTFPFPAMDIDGFPRSGASADCGAYEFQ